MPRQTLKGRRKINVKSRRRGLKRKSLKIQNQKPKVLIINNGQMTTTTTTGNKTQQREVNWNGKYDGKNATIHAKISGDGKTEEFNKTLNEQDIRNLLALPMKNDTLDERLIGDWPTSIDTNANKMLFPDEPMETRKFTAII